MVRFQLGEKDRARPELAAFRMVETNLPASIGLIEGTPPETVPALLQQARTDGRTRRQRPGDLRRTDPPPLRLL